MRIYCMKEVECPTCDGSGIIANPIYEDLANHMAQWRLHNLEASFPARDAEEDRWMIVNGGGRPGQWPTEEWPCSGCKGRGKRSIEIDLADALKELGVVGAVEAL